MESFEPTPPAPQETDAEKKTTEIREKIQAIDEQITDKRAEWRKIEEQNYNLRINSSADGNGRPVDFVKLKQGDVVEQELHNAYMDAKRSTQMQMDNLRAEMDELEKSKENIYLYGIK